jgi:hypothetical protein
MKSHEPYDEIGELLRSHKPRIAPPPGLEARILRSLAPREPSLISRFWPWLLLPPAMAMGLLLLRPTYQRPSPTTHVNTQPPALAAPPIYPDYINPLESESLALERDARRAGRFLIECLPSFGGVAE